MIHPDLSEGKAPAFEASLVLAVMIAFSTRYQKPLDHVLVGFGKLLCSPTHRVPGQ